MPVQKQTPKNRARKPEIKREWNAWAKLAQSLQTLAVTKNVESADLTNSDTVCRRLTTLSACDRHDF